MEVYNNLRLNNDALARISPKVSSTSSRNLRRTLNERATTKLGGQR